MHRIKSDEVNLRNAGQSCGGFSNEMCAAGFESVFPPERAQIPDLPGTANILINQINELKSKNTLL